MTQEQIWDMLAERAKAKFDNEGFLSELEKNYNVKNRDIVRDAIERFAVCQTQDVLINEMHDDLSSKNMNWPKDKMREFFSDKEVLWDKEILAFNHSLAKYSDDPEVDKVLVLERVNEILANS